MFERDSYWRIVNDFGVATVGGRLHAKATANGPICGRHNVAARERGPGRVKLR